MPELPEVETVVRSLRPKVKDKVIAQVDVIKERIIANLEADEFIELLEQKKITDVTRTGKYIICHLSNGYYLVVHLRMTGQFIYQTELETSKYDCFKLCFKAGDILKLSSKRTFTRAYLVDDLAEAGSLTKIGPEPIADDFSQKDFKELFKGRRGRIKPLLLNQRFIAGLGNIYVDEALYLAGIHPLRTADTLKEVELEKLYTTIVEVLAAGIKNRGTTKWDYVDADGKAGTHQNYLKVYDHQGDKCPECESEIEKIKVSGRGTYFCPSCQQEE